MKSSLFIHHTDDPSTKPQFQKVYDYHNRGAPRDDGTRKWPPGHGMQYHFFIESFGELWKGKDQDKTAWHSNDPYWNDNALAVCLAGDFTHGDPTDQQLATLYNLWKSLSYPKIMLHKDVRDTECPGTFPFKSELRARYLLDLRNRLATATKALVRFVGTVRGNMLKRLTERLRKLIAEEDHSE